MIATAAAAYWMLSASTFEVDQATLSGDLKYVNAASVLAAAGVGDGQHPNVFKLSPNAMERAIASFPSVASVKVSTTLPNNVTIDVAERVPVFAINRGSSTYVLDANGTVLAIVPAGSATNLGLPTVDDQRAQVDPLVAGGTLDPVDLAAILQLGALTPATIDSAASSLALALTDENGFVMSAEPQGWQAIFGQYTPNLRPTDLIPRQVQCLRSLLGDREQDVRTVYLAPLDERCGTFLPDATPFVPTPAPTKSR